MEPTGLIYILAGTTREYTTARQKLNLIPKQAFWVTRISNLNGLRSPRVYRYGSWKNLPQAGAIEDKLLEIKAVVEDIE
jgi:hypothetical protein